MKIWLSKLFFLLLVLPISVEASVFYNYTDRVELTGFGYGAWGTFDIAPFLENQSAKGIVVEIRNTNATFGQTRNGGVRCMSCVAEWHQLVSGGAYTMMCVGFEAGQGKNIQIRAADSDVHIYIKAEIHSGAKFHSPMLDISPTIAGELSTWIDRTVTPIGDDSVSDITAVIIGVRSGNAESIWNTRRKGSAETETFSSDLQDGYYWMPVEVDSDGKYQIWGNGKAAPFATWLAFLEMGYLKGDGVNGFVGIDDPTKLNLPVATTFTTLDLSAVVPVGTKSVYGRWAFDAGLTQNSILYIREIGSNDTAAKYNWPEQITTVLCNLDKNRQCEYWLATVTSADLWVTGYEVQLPQGTNKIVIDSGEITNDSGNITIGGNN